MYVLLLVILDTAELAASFQFSISSFSDTICWIRIFVCDATITLHEIIEEKSENEKQIKSLLRYMEFPSAQFFLKWSRNRIQKQSIFFSFVCDKAKSVVFITCSTMCFWTFAAISSTSTLALTSGLFWVQLTIGKISELEKVHRIFLMIQ